MVNLPIVEPDHYHKSCSGAKQWKNCPGSVNTPRPKWALEDTGSEAAERGSLGHAMVEANLKGEKLDPGWQKQLDEMDESSRGFLQWQVGICLTYVRDLIEQYKPDLGIDTFDIEVKIRSNTIDEHGGTIDILIVTADTIHVVDFKFGEVIVYAVDNDQLMAYLHLARQKYPGRKKFFATIMQPTDAHDTDPDTAEFTHDQLQNDLLWMIEASQQKHFKAGDWCHYCDRGAFCDYNREDLRQQLTEFPNILQAAAQATPTPEDVAMVESVVALARRAAKAADDGAKLLKAWSAKGIKLDRHHVREEYKRAWKSEEAVEETLGDIDEFSTRKLMTPRQVYMAHFKEDGLSINQFYDKFSHAIKINKTGKLITGKAKNDKCRDPELPDLTK